MGVRREISDEHVRTLSEADRGDYWWYAVRRAQVDAALRAHGATGAMSYLDFGCGPGGMMAHVVETHRPARALGLDGTEAAVAIAVERGLDARLADFREPLELPFAPDVVTSLDVLEHLEDPRLALRRLAEAARPDALLIVTVPAMPSLWSRWDELSGHHLRYTRPLLRRHLEDAGWRVERLRAFFGYCVPPAWFQRRVLRSVQEVEFPPVAPWVNALMTAAGSVERALGNPSPVGTSLLAVARRRDG